MSGLTRRWAPRWNVLVVAALVLAATLGQGVVGPVPVSGADSYVPVSGAGSTWSENALDQWIRDVQQYGMRVNYAGTGSTDGRQEFLNGTVDFAASDIPFQSHPEDGSAPEDPAAGSYAYMPITAGGTAFMYNLNINGQRVTNLRLSGENLSKILTGVITNWDDPALAADNPGLRLPNLAIVPVVRSDGAGDTFELTQWMISQYPSLWTAYCQRSGRAPACGPTSFYPTVSGMIGQSGDLGVAGYISQSYADGSIGYVNYSYALNAGFPVAQLLNAAHYYTEPTPQNVAVSLLDAQIDTTDVNDPSLYLTEQLGNVYTDPDPRTYPLSSYSYLILPMTVQGQFTKDKGTTLAAFSYYAMCQGQQESASLGYSPMPMNLVQASFTQIAKIPGAVVQDINLQSCDNPTFSSAQGANANLLAETAPYPPACDLQGATQCSTGTGGATAQTPVQPGSPAAVAASHGTGVSNGGSGGSGGGGGSSGGGVGVAGAAGAGGTAGGATSDQGGQGCAAAACPAGASTGTSSTGAGTDPSENPQNLATTRDWLGTGLSLAVLLGLLAILLVPALIVLRRRRPGPGVAP